jgi:precorrin-6x reductase
MANTKSIQKVLNYLKTKKGAVSPSEICLDVSLKYNSVKDVLEILKTNNQIILLTTGKNTLVQLKERDKNEHK